MGFAVLTDDQLMDIHAASLRLLYETGVRVYSDEAIDLMCKAGAMSGGDGIVHLPPAAVRRALEHCSPEVVLHGRFGHPPMVVGGSRVHFGTMAYPTVVLDWETDEYRPSLLRDLADVVTMADSLPTMDFIMPVCCPTDVDQGRADRYMWKACLVRSKKPVISCCFGKEGLEDLVRMICAISGDMRRFRSEPHLAILAGAAQPLMIPDNDCVVIVGAAREGIPILIGTGPMAGATGPVTLAGCVAQMNAELLGCIVLAKAANPEVPLIYCSIPKTFDMHAVNLVTSGPETVLEQLAEVQLAKFYRLPAGGSGLISDAKAADAQMGWECMATSLLAALAGMNLMIGAASIDAEFILSLEALAMHHEMVGFVSRILRGMDVDDEHLAMSTIKATGPAGEFLTADHTLKHFRDEQWMPSLSLRASYSSWQELGSKSLSDHAKDLVRKKLSSPRVPYVSKDLEERLDGIVEGM